MSKKNKIIVILGPTASGKTEWGISFENIVVSIEAKKVHDQKWEAYTDNGREKTGLDVIDWAKKVEELGAGEILLTSIDAEGTKKGFDIELIKKVAASVSIPVIASGGAGKVEHFSTCMRECNIDAIAAAAVLHYNELTINDVKQHISQQGEEVRKI